MKLRRILITDDDEDDRFFIRQALNRKLKTAVIYEARNGEEALRTLTTQHEANQEIDLLLLDINMPGMGGLEVLQKLTETTDLKAIRTVVISTSREAMLAKKAYHYGASSYITKPTKLADYDRIVEALKICFLGELF